jgi:uncharacterized protein (DUF1015 family)
MSTEPIACATDAEGVVSTLWAATNPALAMQLAEFMSERSIFIADGHHRYGTALAYRDLRRERAGEVPESQPEPAYDLVLMALVNMDDPDLVVLPTHRVADAPGDFDAETFTTALRDSFDLTIVAPDSWSAALESLTAPGFLLKTRGDDTLYLAALRDDIDVDTALPLARSKAWKSLDVAVLQELALDPLLDIHPDRPDTLDRLKFVKDATDALGATDQHDVTFVLRATRMDQLRSVALAGETMPQKSTYFYPKLLSGLIFRSAE